MNRNKITLLEKIKHLFLSHPWLKIISLILAIISWLYINYEVLAH
ncbi:MAG: hypothetical protein WAQ07_01385 [Candidatus Omnitrophota bacterium]